MLQPASETAHLELPEARLKAFLGMIGYGEAAFSLAAPSVVSPIHRAVENACFAVTSERAAPLFVKVGHGDMSDFVDIDNAAHSSRIAGENGVAPRLLHADPRRRILAFDYLDSSWRWARMDDFIDPALIERVIAAKRAVHGAAAFKEQRSVFDLIRDYSAMATERRVFLPADIPALLGEVARVEAAITASGCDSRPCHADGVASNIMIGPGGAVRLVDFEWARQTDPIYDFATLAVEAFQFDGEIWPAVEMFCGKADQQVFCRARLYGIADDIMWSLWGFLSFAGSPRETVEFVKYAEWRLLRARMNLGDPGYARWLAKC